MTTCKHELIFEIPVVQLYNAHLEEGRLLINLDTVEDIPPEKGDYQKLYCARCLEEFTIPEEKEWL